MLNVNSVKTLQKALNFNEFGVTGNFIVNGDINLLYNVCNECDNGYYEITIINLQNDTYTNYTYKTLNSVKQMFVKKFNLK